MTIPITLVASGFVSLEGPVVDAAGNLYFSDLRAGGVHRLGPDGTHEVVIPDRAAVGGICVHASGGLVVTGPSVAHIASGETRVLLELDDLADRPGTAAGGFNDMAADRAGCVLAGVLRHDDRGEPTPGELVRITGSHQYDVVYADVHPNGVAFSLGDDRLYVADTFRRQLVVFDVVGDRLWPLGTISTVDVPGLPDGIATDEDGGVWVAFYRGGCIARFDPAREAVRVIEMPAPKPLSLCFGGPDCGDLYVVTGRSEPGASDTGCIYRLPAGVRGVPVHAATV
jgi:sugar lactone lactonase YvrE